MTMSLFARVAFALTFLVFLAAPTRAQSVTDFYRGKTIEIQNAYSVGGGYDIYARMIARHIGKHIPGNPQVVPKNMEGAGGLRPAHLVQFLAPPDVILHRATSPALAFVPPPGYKDAHD